MPNAKLFLDNLEKDLNENPDIKDSFQKFVTGLAAEIKATKNNAAAMESLASELETRGPALFAAIDNTDSGTGDRPRTRDEIESAGYRPPQSEGPSGADLRASGEGYSNPTPSNVESSEGDDGPEVTTEDSPDAPSRGAPRRRR